MTLETRLRHVLETKRAAVPPMIVDFERVVRSGRRRVLLRRGMAGLAGVAALVILVVGTASLTRQPSDMVGSQEISYTPFVVVGGDLSAELAATLNRRDLTVVQAGSIEGDPRLVPPVGTVIRELHYSNQAGTFDLISYEGFAMKLSDLTDVYPDAQPVDINGRDGLALTDGGTRMVIWVQSSDLTLYVGSTNELTADQVETIAQSVRNTTEQDWKSLPTTVDD